MSARFTTPVGREVSSGGKLVAFISHLLLTRARGTLIWGLAIGLYTAAMVAAFPSFESTGQLESFTQSMPEGFSEGLGITDMGSIEGFLSAEAFSIVVPLALAFFPILALSAAIAGAEERGSIDVLLSNPLPRWQLVIGSFVATGISLLGVVAIIGVMTWGTAALVGVELSLETTAGGVLNLWPLCMFFGGLALLCLALFRRRMIAVAIPGAALLAMYLLDVLANLSEGFESLQPISVFHHYGSAIENGIDWAGFAGISGFAVLFAVLAALAFQRRDIYT